MTIIAGSTIRTRQLSGYADPRLPIGFWQSDISVTGDASGGNREADIQFATSQGARTPNAFSLEQLVITDSEITAKTVLIFTLNLDQIDGAAFPSSWTTTLAVPNSGAGLRMPAADANAFRGIFLGRQQLGVIPVTSILAVVAANDDGEVLRILAQGYIWGPRGINIEGGFTRPGAGLYLS